MLRFSMMAASRQEQPPVVVTLTSTGETTQTPPAGAKFVKIQCIGGGGSIFYDESNNTYYGGGGGAYAQATSMSLTGISSIIVSVGNFTQPSYAYDGALTVYCAADAGGAFGAGGLAFNGIGNVKNNGGQGSVVVANNFVAGGGAGNDGGAGGNASGTTPGAAGSGTAAAGAGGQLYGGGGQPAINSGLGLRGWVQLTYTF